MEVNERHPYLVEKRGIPAALLQDWRFAGRIKTDRHGNAVFAHFDTQGVCGFEMRGENFKGFSKFGQKGLFLSKQIPEDDKLIIAESGIDALSYAALIEDGYTRYASICGNLSHRQPDLIRKQAERLARGSRVIAATDSDAAGDRLADMVEAAVDVVGISFVRHRVPEGQKDWNDVLRSGLRL